MKESKGFKSDHSPFFLLDLAAVVQPWSLVLATGSGSLTHDKDEYTSDSTSSFST